MKKFALIAGAIIFVGAFLSFINSINHRPLGQAVVLGVIDAILYVAAVYLTHRIMDKRLQVFNPKQKWLLLAIFYVIALTGAFFTGTIIKSHFFHSSAFSSLDAYELLWNFWLNVISDPFGDASIPERVPFEIRQLFASFLILILLFGFVAILGSWIEIRWREARFRQAKERAELTALRAQMDPHFLFNSLNTITSLVRQDAAKAENLLIQLSELLRHVFKNSSEEKIALNDEITFTKHFIELLQARFGDRLDIEWKIELEKKEVLVPAFLLQPLVENAVKHGWVDQNEQLKIQISVRELEKDIEICISDNGQGIQPTALKKLPNAGHALANLAERLELFYSKKNMLKIESEWKKGTTIELRILK